MPVLSLSFASTSAKRPPLGVVDHYGSRKGVHPFTGSLTTFNVTGCLVYLFGEAMIMQHVPFIHVNDLLLGLGISLRIVNILANSPESTQVQSLPVAPELLFHVGISLAPLFFA